MPAPVVILSEAELARVLMVRAAEDANDPALPQSAREEAGRSAIGARGDAARIVGRSALLFARLPASLRDLALATTRREPILPLCALGGAALGLGSNYLDPSGSVHVLYNPLMLLLLWNLFVLGLTAARVLRRRDDSAIAVAAPLPPLPAAAVTRKDPDSLPPPPVGGIVRWLVLRLWTQLLRLHAAIATGSFADLRAHARAASRFLALRFGRLDDVIRRRLALVLHASALAVALGALAGTYLRGLVFDYRVVWRSTFLTDPDSVAVVLNVLFAPALLLVEHGFLAASDVEPLLTGMGAQAAPWIHRMALSLGAFAILPRLILLARATRAERQAAAAMRIDPTSPYCAVVLADIARLERLRDEHARAALQAEIDRFAATVAHVARSEFFEARVEPILQEFRDTGGRLSVLRARLTDEAERFTPTLSRYSEERLRELVAALRARLGIELEVAADRPLPLQVNVPASAARQLGQDAGIIGGTVVAGTAATLSGGLGKSLGVAILAVLLHTSGPIGLLLGAIVGAAVAAGTYFAGRDLIEEAMHEVPLPAFLARRAIPPERLVAAREETAAAIRDAVAAHLRPVLEAAVRDAFAARDDERLRTAADSGHPQRSG